jgi:kynurenine formamidase
MRQVRSSVSDTRNERPRSGHDGTAGRRGMWPNPRGLLGLSGAGAAAALAGLLAPGSAAAQTPPGRKHRVTDLTHVLTAEFPLFPGYDPPSFEPTSTVEEDGYLNYRITMAEHSGTHLDAPAHFVSGGETVDVLPAESLLAPLRVIRIAERAAQDPNATLSVEDVRAHERGNGRIPRGAVVAIDSGWSSRVDDPDAYLGLDADGGLNFPGFSPDAAEFLISERGIVGAGVDTLSLDPGESQDFAAHGVLLGAGAYGIENLANLAEAPGRGATVVVGAPRHQDGSGGPTRVLALG